MTDPYHPPGPGGWGQPQYGQPGGPYPPTGPQQQPGGPYPPGSPQQYPGMPYPASGPYVQPGYGPGGPIPPGAPPPFPYGAPGGLPGPGGPWGQPKRNSPLPWILGGVGGLVVLIGIAVAVVLVVSSGPSAQQVAQQYVNAANAQDYQTAATLVCAADKPNVRQLDPTQDLPPDLQNITAQLTLEGVQQTGDSTASATINLSFQNVPSELQGMLQDRPVTFSMTKENDGWKMCPTPADFGSNTVPAPDGGSLGGGSSDGGS